MLMLVLSILMLWAAPLLYRLAHLHRRMSRAMELIILVVLAVLVLWHLLPESVAAAGWLAVVFAALGFILPSVAERAWHAVAHRFHWIPVILGTLGLAIHAAMDGAAIMMEVQMELYQLGEQMSFQDPSSASLGSYLQNGLHGYVGEQGHNHNALPLAIVLHRLPVGLLIWWALYPKYGALAPSGVLAFISAMTFTGYVYSVDILASLNGATGFGLFQALVAGSLLHLTFDRHSDRRNDRHHNDEHGDYQKLRRQKELQLQGASSDLESFNQPSINGL